MGKIFINTLSVFIIHLRQLAYTFDRRLQRIDRKRSPISDVPQATTYVGLRQPQRASKLTRSALGAPFLWQSAPNKCFREKNCYNHWIKNTSGFLILQPYTSTFTGTFWKLQLKSNEDLQLELWPGLTLTFLIGFPPMKDWVFLVLVSYNTRTSSAFVSCAFKLKTPTQNTLFSHAEKCDVRRQILQYVDSLPLLLAHASSPQQINQ